MRSSLSLHRRNLSCIRKKWRRCYFLMPICRMWLRKPSHVAARYRNYLYNRPSASNDSCPSLWATKAPVPPPCRLSLRNLCKIWKNGSSKSRRQARCIVTSPNLPMSRRVCMLDPIDHKVGTLVITTRLSWALGCASACSSHKLPQISAVGKVCASEVAWRSPCLLIETKGSPWFWQSLVLNGYRSITTRSDLEASRPIPIKSDQSFMELGLDSLSLRSKKGVNLSHPFSKSTHSSILKEIWRSRHSRSRFLTMNRLAENLVSSVL